MYKTEILKTLKDKGPLTFRDLFYIMSLDAKEFNEEIKWSQFTSELTEMRDDDQVEAFREGSDLWYKVRVIRSMV